jgi:spore coat polysaccharide biosynthesis protein SpsF (cytidylyltransferase family)
MTEKILAIIQARMGSTRLPGKVMRTLGQFEKPSIGLLISRLAQSKSIDEIILATSNNSENDPLCEYISSLGYAVFRGDEDDVLQRFYQASIAHQGDTIVRITGDSPLIDAQICDQLIEFHRLNNADYSYLSERFCEGVDCEVINIQSLVKANTEAIKPSEREHVTLYVYNHSDKFKCQKLENDSDDSCYRFTVDNLEDAQVVEHIINHFGNEIEKVNTLQIKQYLLHHPKVNAINKDIIRNEGLLKSLAAEQASDINQTTK